MNCVSLFSGIGGLDLGLERAGFKVIRQVEIDPFCQKVLNKHWPEVSKGDDIRKERPEEYDYGTIDLVCGGFPCQDLSVAGKRQGLAGERSGLFYELLRIVDSQPTAWVLAENVPGLLSSKQGEDFATILGELSGFFPEAPKEGWRNSGVCWGPKGCVAWRVLDAQYLGVAQRRRRVFIVRSPATAGGSAFEVLFESESLPGNPPPSREKGKGIAGIFATSPDGSGRETETSPTLDSRAKDDPRRNQGGVIVSVLGHTKSNGLGIARQDVANTLESFGSANQAVFCDDTCGPLDGGSGQRGWKVSAENAADRQLVVASTLRSGGCGGIPSSRGENLVYAQTGFGQWKAGSTVSTLRSGGGISPSDPSNVVVHCIKGAAIGRKPENGPQWGEVVSDGTSYTLNATERHAVVVTDQGDTIEHANHRDVIAPLCWESLRRKNNSVYMEHGDIAPTLQGFMGTGGNNVPMVGVRRLTPIECARLQGFPDDWCILDEKTPDSPQYRAYGNAVCVNVAEWIGKRMRDVMSS